MPTYTITDPKSGKRIDLEGDSPPSEQELEQIFLSVNSGTSQSGKLINALKLPEKLSRQGYQQLQDLIPSDVQTPTNIPGFGMANAKQAIGVVKEIAPPFISPASIAMGVGAPALKMMAPLARGAGGLVAKGAEALSGLEHKTPGILTDAAKSGKVLFGKGSQAAEPFYNAAGKVLPHEGRIFNDVIEPKELVVKAMQFVKEGGKLEPYEAFTIRKAASGLLSKGKLVKDNVLPFIKKLDAIAKSDPNISAGDIAHASGIKSEAIRSLLPLNKTGGASTFKTMVGAALKGAATLGAMSPLVQGTIATGIGGTARLMAPIINNPDAVVGAISAAKVAPKLFNKAKVLTEDLVRKFLRKAKGDPDKARDMALKQGYEIPE